MQPEFDDDPDGFDQAIPPKRLLPYRLADDAEPFAKRRVTFTIPETGEIPHAVEMKLRRSSRRGDRQRGWP